MSVEVFSLPDCPQCRQTKRFLDARGVPHTVTDVSADRDVENYVRSLGYTSAPVVVVDRGKVTERHWSGFRPDLLAGLGGERR